MLLPVIHFNLYLAEKAAAIPWPPSSSCTDCLLPSHGNERLARALGFWKCQPCSTPGSITHHWPPGPSYSSSEQIYSLTKAHYVTRTAPEKHWGMKDSARTLSECSQEAASPGRRQQGDMPRGWRRDARICSMGVSISCPRSETPSCDLWLCHAKSCWLQYGCTLDSCVAHAGLSRVAGVTQHSLAVWGDTVPSAVPEGQAQVSTAPLPREGSTCRHRGGARCQAQHPPAPKILLALPISKDSWKDFSSNCLGRRRRH